MIDHEKLYQDLLHVIRWNDGIVSSLFPEKDQHIEVTLRTLRRLREEFSKAIATLDVLLKEFGSVISESK
jgi:hypothetical protein